MAYRLPSLAIQHRTLRRLNGELPPMGLTTTYIQHLDKGGAFYWNVQIRYRFVRGNHWHYSISWGSDLMPLSDRTLARLWQEQIEDLIETSGENVPDPRDAEYAVVMVYGEGYENNTTKQFR